MPLDIHRLSDTAPCQFLKMRCKQHKLRRFGTSTWYCTECNEQFIKNKDCKYIIERNKELKEKVKKYEQILRIIQRRLDIELIDKGEAINGK